MDGAKLGTFEIEVDEFDLFRFIHDGSLLQDEWILNVTDINFNEIKGKWIVIGLILLNNSENIV